MNTTTALPSAVEEAVDHLRSHTGAAKPDALVVALSVLAGVAGPVWRVLAPGGTQYSTALHVAARIPDGAEQYLRDLQSGFDSEYRSRIEGRIRLGDVWLRKEYIAAERDFKAATEEKEMAEKRAEGRTFPSSEAREKIASAHSKWDEASRRWSDVYFMQRPWIVGETFSAETIAGRISNECFDQGLLHGRAEELIGADGTIAETGTESDRLFRNGWAGHPYSPSFSLHVCATISNLWTTTDPIVLKHVLHRETFLAASLDGDLTDAGSGNDLALWHTLIKGAFYGRLRVPRGLKALSEEAIALYEAETRSLRMQTADLPVVHRLAASLQPVQALKLAALLCMARCIEAAEEPPEIDAGFLAIGFECVAELMKRRVQFSQAVDSDALPPEVDALVNRVRVNGPMAKRALVRTYHSMSVSELERIVSEAQRRGLVEFDGKTVRLASSPSSFRSDVSVSACQQPAAEISEPLVLP